VKLTFDSFATEDGRDIVRIYDGNSTDYKLIAELTGPSISADTYWSKQQYMYINFVSDTSIAYQGFNATFQSMGKLPILIMPSQY
jgi:alpha-glucuronidase